MTRPIAFLFPGQGSQAVGMLADLAATYPQVQATFAEAGAVLGEDLWRLVSSGPAAELDRTEYTQPAMLAAGVAVWRCWQAQDGPAPAVMAGHSLGEYTALVCAEALTFADALALVAARARLMQAAVPVGAGAMAALLGLDDAGVQALCAEQAQGAVLEAVNYNAPGQVVIAGDSAAVARAVGAARGAGAKRAVVLPVSVPSHCALMRPAAAQLAERLAAISIQTPTIPVVHNVNAVTASDPAQIRDLLARQLYSPVRWVECVQAIGERAVTLAFEAGPGKVLTGLGKRIDKRLTTRALDDPASLADGLSAARAAAP